LVDVNDIDISRNLGDGMPMDGVFDINHENILNEIHTIKDVRMTSGKKSKYRSEVADYNTEKNVQEDRSQMVERIHQDSQISAASTRSMMVCRICLDYDNMVTDVNDDGFNPMISPCNCSGTMGGIHLKCLREWLERNKCMKAVKGHVIIKYKKVHCELCK
jgi:hypothetical protein